jgi:hypothetical protein
LGNGTTTDLISPVEVSGLAGVAALAAGTAHTCALLQDGTLACWGENATGQLGDGTTARRLQPAAVGGLAETVSTISVGYSHTCAVLQNGAFVCWGSNGYGQLGNAKARGILTPQASLLAAISASVTSGLTIQVSWMGADYGAGIQSFDVQYQVGSGEWTAWLTATSATGQSFTATAGQVYTFRVRVNDGAGGTSGWVTSATCLGWVGIYNGTTGRR